MITDKRALPVVKDNRRNLNSAFLYLRAPEEDLPSRRWARFPVRMRDLVSENASLKQKSPGNLKMFAENISVPSLVKGRIQAMSHNPSVK